VVERRIAAGATVDQPHKNGRTPLHFASLPRYDAAVYRPEPESGEWAWLGSHAQRPTARKEFRNKVKSVSESLGALI